MLFNKSTCFLFIVFFTLPKNFYGQAEMKDTSLVELDFEKAERSIFLLRNEKQLIPLQGLDMLTLESINIGGDSINYFDETLSNYTLLNFETFDLEKDTFEKRPERKNGLRILHFHLHKLFELNTEVIAELQKIINQPTTISVVFDEFGILNSFPFHFEKSSYLIYVKGAGEYHQSLAAQLIFGGFGAKQRLKKDLNDHFRKGDGLSSEEGIRLRYSPSEVLGMNAQLLRDSISSIAQMAIDSGAFPGCQVLIAKDGHVVFYETWGYQTYDKKQAVRQDDIYDFASVTKITGALPALMKLHGEGRFDLDAPLKVYFPKFKNSNKAELKMRPILAHNAQLQPWIPYWRSTLKKNGKYKCRTFKTNPSKRFPTKVTDHLYLHRNYKKRIYKAIKKSPLNEEKGYKYSGLTFYLFPKIVSDLVNQDFETYLKNTFYRPLGAFTLTYNPYLYFPLDRIVPTEKDTFFRMVQIHGMVHDEGAAMMGGVSSNAGLFGTANDLAKLMQMYLNGGTYGGQRFIAESSVNEFTHCQYCDQGNRRGLGFDKPLIEYHPQNSSVSKDASSESYGHSGYTGTFVWVDPEYDLIYIFFSNRVYQTRENRKIYDLNVRPMIHQVIYDSFLE
jgi:CubicO group peptidase (beta-lactamase class C family)